MYKKREKTHRVFALAGDYYRARVIKVHGERPVDLEWREDVLYTAPKAYPSKLQIHYHIQVLNLENTVYELAVIKDRSEARKKYKRLKDDLRQMTKLKFDEKYSVVDTIESTAVNPMRVDKELFGNAMLFTGTQSAAKPKEQGRAQPSS